jgi:hypothetical protein
LLFTDGIKRCAHPGDKCKSSFLAAHSDLPGYSSSECDNACTVRAARDAGDDDAWVAVADLNGDASPDLVTIEDTESGEGEVTVELADDSGGFEGQRIVARVPGAVGVASGDLDMDGIADLVTASPGSREIFFLRGVNDGSFEPPQALGAGHAPAWVAVNDLNGDRVPDLVTEDAETGSLWYMAGNGDGSFQPAEPCACE